MPIARIENGVVVEIIEGKRIQDVPEHKRDSFVRVDEVPPDYSPSTERLGAVTLTLRNGIVERSREVVPMSRQDLIDAINSELGVRIFRLSGRDLMTESIVDQVNAHSRIGELQEIKTRRALTSDEERELSELRVFLRKIQELRRAAAVIKEMVQIPSDYADDKYWE